MEMMHVNDTTRNMYPNCSKEILEKLESLGILCWFDNIMSYEGDSELCSSCNDEYNIDINECLITNGIVNRILATINNGTEVQYLTSVRGASYVIILSFGDYGTPKFDLRIDESRYINTVEEIDRTLKRIERSGGYDQMRYYLKEWRTDERFIIHNNDTVIGRY